MILAKLVHVMKLVIKKHVKSISVGAVLFMSSKNASLKAIQTELRETFKSISHINSYLIICMARTVKQVE